MRIASLCFTGAYAIDAENAKLNSYNVFVVLDDSMQKLGEFRENELLRSLASLGNEITVGDIAKGKKQRLIAQLKTLSKESNLYIALSYHGFCNLLKPAMFAPATRL